MNINLQKYGWNDELVQSKKDSKNPNLEHGRIISVHKSRYEVITEEGIFSCEILGNLQFQKDPLLLPAVGDWVLYDRYKETRIVHEVLPRQSLIKRQKKHDRFPKPIAANIQKALIVQSVGQDFSIKRLERILVHVNEAGIIPVVIINKIDLVEDLDTVKNQMKTLQSNLEIHYTSFVDGVGIQSLAQSLIPGETVMFIGSSGVGKSSIINAMIGEEVQVTNIVSIGSGKGKHTTTARRLLLLESGVLVIDTPGTREFGMHGDDSSAIEESFNYVESIALGCKFGNCNHGKEPGCRVQESLLNGSLDQEGYDRYLALVAEMSQTAKQMRQGGGKKKQTHQPLRSIRPGKTKSKKRK